MILNDNDMSISPPVGALNRYLARLMSGKFYAAARDAAKKVLKNAPPLFELARALRGACQGHGRAGHDLRGVRLQLRRPDRRPRPRLADPDAARTCATCKGPQFLHVVTKKGYGYKLAEADPVIYHGPGKFDPAVGIVKPATPPQDRPSRRSSASGCATWPRPTSALVGITPAMREGSGMVEFEKRFPKRYFDVGIAEQHAVTFAAGLACEGLKPVVAIYSTFLQRGYDQLIHDVAIQNLPVVFALDRAGLVGADGATHAGAYDIAYLRCIPNMSVLAPADENECRQALYTAFAQDHPVAVRYPRGAGAGVAVAAGHDRAAVGQGRDPPRDRAARAAGRRIAILAFGTLLYPALAAAEKLDATVANMRFVKPLDVALVTELARTPRRHRHRRRRLRDGRRRQRGARGAGRGRHRRCRCCTLGPARRSSSSTATRPSCWRCAGSTPPASSSRSSSASAPRRRWFARGQRLSRRDRQPAADVGAAAIGAHARRRWHGLATTMTNLTDALHIPDTQSERDERHLAIQRVGVQGRALSAAAAGSAGAVHADGRAMWASTWRCRPSRRARTCRASSPGSTRSTRRSTRPRCARELARDARRCCGADEGRIEARFPFFLRKRAPVSGVQSLLDYQGRWIAETRAGATTVLGRGRRAGQVACARARRRSPTTARTTSART